MPKKKVSTVPKKKVSTKETVGVGYRTSAENRELGGIGPYWFAENADGERINTAATHQDLVAQLSEFEMVDIDKLEYNKKEEDNIILDGYEG